MGKADGRARLPGGVLLAARSHGRARWRGLLGLGLVVAATATVVVGAWLAADRAESSYARLRDATEASDVLVSPLDGRTGSETADLVRSVPGVRAARVERELFVRPVGSGLMPDFNLYALDTGDGGGLDRVVVRHGRAADPTSPDEVMVSERLADALGLDVGDPLPLESFTDAWVETSYSGGDAGPADGPSATPVVVGIARTPVDFGRVEGALLVGPALEARFAGSRTYEFVAARLDPAILALDGEQPPALAGAQVMASWSSSEGVTAGLRTIGVTLRVVAVIAAVVGGVALALMVSRLARAAQQDRDRLVALGWTGSDVSWFATVVLLPPTLAGALVGTAAGVVVSPQLLVGLARRVDPSPDAVVAAVLTVLALAAAWVAATTVGVVAGVRWVGATRGRHAGVPARFPLVRPLPLSIGIRQSVFGGAGTGARSSRAALLGLVLGVAVAVALLGITASMERLGDDGSLAGSWTGETLDSGEALDAYESAMPILEGDPRVAALVGVHTMFGVNGPAGQGVPVLVRDVRRGAVADPIMHGRAPATADEVALGPVTMERLGARQGEVVTLTGSAGSHGFRVVGTALFPEGDFNYDDGALLTPAGGDLLAGDAVTGSLIHSIGFRWADGVDVSAADAGLRALGYVILPSGSLLVPRRVASLGDVERLPTYLAAFLLLVSIASVTQALAITVRSRARELGTARALGMTAAATGWAVVVQAGTLLAVAVVLGIPLGILLGRQAWGAIADSVHVVASPAVAWERLASAVVVLTLLVGLAVAVQAWRTARLRPARVLRTE